ncbi:hypothetical protein ABTK33_20535, partial [Acinetobacter baumannii]
GKIRDLAPLDLLKLLFCPDRDVARDAQIELETHARSGFFTPAMIVILNDETHPYRRVAQWCVLDMFEDLPHLTQSPEELDQAVQAIK